MSAASDNRVALPMLCGVVVTYHPEPAVFDNLRSIVRECGRVLVVDNGSSSEAGALIASIAGVDWISLAENRGLATALNIGADRALAMGYQWIVVFDQDSCPREGMIAALWAMHDQVPSAAVIGPSLDEQKIQASAYRWIRQHPRWPWLFQRANDGLGLEAVTMVVTSGSLIDLAWWQKLGRFDETLFIDYIDIDYCLRVIRAGCRVTVASKAVLEHRLGARQSNIILGHEFRPMHHAAFRHYYIARNRVLVWRRHALAVPHWALFDLFFAGYNALRVIVFESPKWTKLKAMLLGTWDGLWGRSGPCPEHRLRALKP